MKRNGMKITGTAVGAAVLLVTGALFYLYLWYDTKHVEPKPAPHGQEVVDVLDIEDNGTLNTADQTAEYADSLAPAEDRLQSPPADWAEFEEWAAEDLRTQFGQTIRNKGTQASLLELRQFLKENDPQDWETKLHDLLQKAFPDLADQVLDTFSKMDVYNEWFEENKLDLAAMQGEEIKDALWQKREEIFGEDATEVWTSKAGTEYFRDMIDILEEAYHVPIENKLHVFRSAVDESQQGAVRALVPDSRGVMLGAFLDMESVQNELRQMSPDERAESLRHIRRSMGMDEQDIERMEKLDAEREQDWQNGLQYMAERDKLTEDYEGARLAEELRFLRERYFANRAKTIEAEEAAGFFRYNRRRVYGRN